MALTPADAFSALPLTLRADLLSAFSEIVKNYREHRWEPSELNGGKLCEAVYTVCKGWLDGGTYAARAQKPNNFPKTCWEMEVKYASVPNSRSTRILIPRMMLGLYDIRNNRGVGHAGADVDPNHMDATAVLYTAKWLMAELVRVLHTLTTEEASAIVDGLIEREVAWVWVDGDKKRILKKGMTWKQQTLVLLLTEASDVPEADLFRWLEHTGLPSFRKDVLKQLHHDRLIEYDTAARTVRLLPPGVTAAEGLVAPAP
ncbi:hypothetical protein DMB66_24530 [Actinoplanes sp. ATCC 53533]|uniref:hypothetical protein n=1 Tax=Actinoplanes sp. ATCC 53533 TaxID=1288362 RepID=UPI000F7AEEBF|nr:hypothetical protein [Actinoplanes sp. ATCC 53533]RSM61591.1 hypothetical protein DMB66_24530 [Actinoplanes sp. ATCC 53533]